MCSYKDLIGYNLWFTIEIISFYGYILAAIWFIAEEQILSTFGYLNKLNYADQYMYDFINYRRLEIDWLAFIII